MTWDDIYCFVVIAKAGTMSAGARSLGVSVATAGRRLDALEAKLGIKLIHRSPRGIALTRNGSEILAIANVGAAQFGEIQRKAAALRLTGWADPIRISASEPIVSDILAPAAKLLLESDPNIRVDLRSTTETARLASREADVAIRLYRPKGDSLVARRLPALSMSLYASKSYLADRDRRTVDLSRERLLAFDDAYGEIPEVAWIAKLGLTDRIVISTSSTRALLNAVRQGAGIALLPDIFAGKIEDLVRLNVAGASLVRAPWMVVHRDLQSIKQLRTVRAWILQAFQAALRSKPTQPY